MPNSVSFAASIAELAHGEKSRTQSITHRACLMPREPKLALQNRAYLKTSLIRQSSAVQTSMHKIEMS